MSFMRILRQVSSMGVTERQAEVSPPTPILARHPARFLYFADTVILCVHLYCRQ